MASRLCGPMTPVIHTYKGHTGHTGEKLDIKQFEIMCNALIYKLSVNLCAWPHSRMAPWHPLYHRCHSGHTGEKHCKLYTLS